MHKVGSGLGLAFIFLVSLFAAGQDSASSPSPSASDANSSISTEPTTAPSAAHSQPEGLPAAALTLNDVIDRLVQREHYFVAQMRHQHPLVETYLQDLKNDPNGNPYPVKDQYFLGRLDMSDGP